MALGIWYEWIFLQPSTDSTIRPYDNTWAYSLHIQYDDSEMQ